MKIENIGSKVRKAALILQSIVQSVVNILAVSETMKVNVYIFVALGVLSTVLHIVSVYSDKLAEKYGEIICHLGEMREMSNVNTARSIVINTPRHEREPLEEDIDDIPLYPVLRNGVITFVERDDA